jgi:AraC-like DNA-binding protein
MSPKRHTPRLAADSLLGDGGGFRSHVHPAHQLSWAIDGSLSIGAQGATWLVSARVALWVPAGVAHDVTAEQQARMRSLYFRPDRCSVTWSEVTPVDTRGVVGPLMDHMIETEEGPARRRAEQVLLDVLEEVPSVVVRVSRLSDDRGRRVEEALRSDPADGRTLDEWARLVGASGRTLARVIERETGIGFAQWRNQIRIAHAARQLAAGKQVVEVAHECGFASPSAFVAAFRRVVGMTPGRYRASDRLVDEDHGSPGVALTVVEPGTFVVPRSVASVARP